jgi:O-antigen biosynthesis protein
MEGIMISIVLATLIRKPQHKPMILECLDSIKEHSKDYELIISDDGSPLDTGFLIPYADTYIRRSHAGGCAVGWNMGLRLCHGDFLVVISDDVVVTDGWLDALKLALDKCPNSLVSATAVEKMPRVGGPGIVEERRWFPGCCFMLKRSALDIVGYFDEQFAPFNYEDVDYWTRVAKSGHTVARNYNVEVKHKEGQVIHSIENNGSVDSQNRQKYIKKWGFDPIPVLYDGEGKFPWEF